MNFKVQPWNHQLEAIERAKDLPFYALFFQMGAGKSGTTIHFCRHRFNQARRVQRTLILCPPIVVRNWKDEWLKHSSIDPARVITLLGDGKRRLKRFLEAIAKDPDRVVVTNYETLNLLRKDKKKADSGEIFQALLKWRPEILIADECHQLKDSSSLRSKQVLALTRNSGPRPVVYILSGSPVLNSPMDLFHQFLVMDGGRTFGDNFFVFRARFFRDRNAGMPKQKYFPKWEVMSKEKDGFDALAEITRLMQPVAMRVTKEECMDLPPLVKKTIYVEMTTEQRRLYKEMKNDLVTYLRREGDDVSAVTANMALTKALRLMQISSGYVKTVDGEEVTLDASPKTEALRQLLEELCSHHKVLVWAVWKQNYAQIRSVCEALGVEYVEVHGDISDAQKAANVVRFNTDPLCRVLIGHPGSAGIGINLVVASYSIFFSRNFRLDYDEQAEARNHRGGSEIHEKITRINLVAQDTIEELVAEKLANKQEMGHKLLRDLSLELEKQDE